MFHIVYLFTFCVTLGSFYISLNLFLYSNISLMSSQLLCYLLLIAFHLCSFCITVFVSLRLFCICNKSLQLCGHLHLFFLSHFYHFLFHLDHFYSFLCCFVCFASVLYDIMCLISVVLHFFVATLWQFNIACPAGPFTNQSLYQSIYRKPSTVTLEAHYIKSASVCAIP